MTFTARVAIMIRCGGHWRYWALKYSYFCTWSKPGKVVFTLGRGEGRNEIK